MIVILVSLIILILQIVAIIIPKWGKDIEYGIWSDNNKKFKFFDKTGIWKGCEGGEFIVKSPSDPVLPEICGKLPPNLPTYPTNSLYAVRLFVIFGAILVFCGMVCPNNDYKVACLISGGICSIIGIIIYKIKLLKFHDGDCSIVHYKPDISFYLTLSAGILAICFGLIVKYKKLSY